MPFSGLGLMLQGSGSKGLVLPFSGLRLMIQGSGFTGLAARRPPLQPGFELMVWCLDLEAWGLGSEVWSLKFGVRG